MIGKALLYQALVNIRAATMRSILALTGVLVGTAAVVALLSCGKMAADKTLLQFKDLGTELLSLIVYPKNIDNKQSVPLEFWRNVPNHVPQITQVAPYFLHYQPMTFAGKPLQGNLIGADENLADILKIHMHAGVFISFVQSFEPYCVIGHDIAEQIKHITHDSPLGKQLKMGSVLYTIAGVAKPWNGNMFFMDNINNTVIVPIRGLALINQDPAINYGIFALKKDSNLDAVITRLTHLFNLYAPDLGLHVRSSKQLTTSLQNQEKILHLLLLVIGGITLLIGGTGIMNIMLVSVSERKQEIGLRKALGARNRDIQLLFITESILLSSLGGLAGIFLGLLLTASIAFYSAWPFHIYWNALITGFLASVSTGIFFGYYPAKRAALQEPIVSLRSN